MPPNTPPQQPTPNQNPPQPPLTPSGTPPTSVSPTPASPPSPVMPPAPATPATGALPPKKSSKKVVGIIIGVVALVLLPVILLIVFLTISSLTSGKAQSSRVSKEFMSAISTGDITTALTYTDGGAESRQFLEGMAPGVKATSFTEKGSAEASGKWNFLYTLEGAPNNTARTEVEKDSDDGKWYISGFYAGDNLALTAAAISSEPADTTQNTSQCLAQSDFDNWYKSNGGLGKTATENGFKFQDPTYMFTTNVHFPADSLDYASFDNTGAVETIANLANDPAVKGKQFTIRLYGGVGTSQADKDFANQRAEKVKADLVAAGVPADQIAIDPAQSATDYNSNPNAVEKGMTRVVVIKFDPTCSSAANGR